MRHAQEARTVQAQYPKQDKRRINRAAVLGATGNRQRNNEGAAGLVRMG